MWYNKKNNEKAIFPQGGTLIFFGDIFGGRYGENWHQIIDYKYDKARGIYCIYFNEGETCTIYNPKNIEYDRQAFTIKDASRIIWEWYYYGREKIENSLNRLDYKKIDESIVSLERYGNLAANSEIRTFKIESQLAFQFL